MMLMVVLCFLLYAHADNPPTLPERVGRVSLPQGPVIEHDRLDEIAMLVFGHNVSMIQYLYSVTRTEKSYRGKPAFQIFNRRYPSGSTRNDRLLLDKVHEVFLNLAKSVWTRSQARESLIKEWLKLNERNRNSLRGEHPCFVVIDEMARATTLSAPEPGRKVSTQAEGLADGYDRMDEIAMLVYGHNVSMIQYLYSVTHTEKSYRGKPAFQIFEQRYPWRAQRYSGRRKWRRILRDFPSKVHEVFLNLAKSVWTRSQARESLIKEWLQVSSRINKDAHPAFVVMDDMARAQAR